jgi:hypothetical protein
MLSPFIQFFLFREILHPSSIFGVVVIFLAGAVIGVKKIYYDPRKHNISELVSVNELAEPNDADNSGSDSDTNVKYTTEKVRKFNEDDEIEEEVEIDLQNSSQQQKVAWG